MPPRSKVRSGSRVLVVAITTDMPAGIPLGLAENFSVSEHHLVEAHTGVGALQPQEIVHHGVGAPTVSWGRITTIPAESYQKLKITPDNVHMPTHEPITLQILDDERGETICEVVDALPTAFSMSVNQQASLRENVSFQARYVRWASELN